MKNNIIKIYDSLEKEFSSRCSYHQLMLFKPNQFINQGDPLRVENYSEFSNFVDTQHNFSRSMEYLGLIENDFYKNEVDKIYSIASATLNLAEGFNEKVFPVNAIFAQFYQYLFIKQNLENYQSILEIGPGSGYLAAMLAKDGYSLMATDVTQALYLFQSLIFDEMQIGDELLYQCDNYNEREAEKFFTEKIEFKEGKIIHIPWWIFKDLYLANEISIDVMIMNHTALEVHPKCLAYIIALAKKFKVKKFLMESTGNPGSNLKWKDVIKLFRNYSYYCTEIGYDKFFFEFIDKQPSKIEIIKEKINYPNNFLNKIKWKRERFKKEHYINGVNKFRDFIKHFKDNYTNDFVINTRDKKFLDFINNQ